MMVYAVEIERLKKTFDLNQNPRAEALFFGAIETLTGLQPAEAYMVLMISGEIRAPGYVFRRRLAPDGRNECGKLRRAHEGDA